MNEISNNEFLNKQLFVPVVNGFKPKQTINLHKGVKFSAIDMDSTWKENRDVTVVGRSNNELQELFNSKGVDYVKEIRALVESTAELGEKEIWLWDLGSGTGIAGFEMVAAANREKLKENEIAEELVACLRENNVRLNYVGITEVPDQTNSATGKPYQEKEILHHEHSDWVSAVNIAYTLDYKSNPQRSLSEITADFGDVHPSIILANYFFEYLNPETKKGVMLDLADTIPKNAVMLSYPWRSINIEPVLKTHKEDIRAINREILEEVKSRRNIEEIFAEKADEEEREIVGMRFR